MHRLLVALLLVSGCAFGIDGPDPNRPRSQPPQCDTGKGAVVLDGLMAGIAGLIAVSVAESEPGVALLPLGIGALYLGGAVKGNSNANKCRQAQQDYEHYLAARETLDEERARRPVQAATEPPAAMPVAPAPTPTPSASTPAAPVAPTPAMAPPAPSAAAPVASVPPSPAVPPARAPAKRQAKPEPDDDWSSFWREVP